MNQIEMLEEELKKLDNDYYIERRIIAEKIEFARNAIPTKDEAEFASWLHSEMCNMDHTEHCDWYYDEGDWDRYSRSKYLRMTRKLLERFDMDSIEDIRFIINVLKE